MTNDELSNIVDATVDSLREHFDHVQILVSWESDDKNTCDIFRGKGNWYARTGMAKEFLLRDDAHTKAHEIAEQLNSDDEE